MSSHVRVRPEFACPLAAEERTFYSALRRALATDGSSCLGHTFDGGAILRVRTDERRIWSPALHLHVDGEGGGERRVHGRFAPSSPVWTAFVAIYIVLACVAFAALCYGWAQWTLEHTPWAFLGVPAAIALAGFTYGAAFIGQGLGAEDMYELRTFVEGVADDVSKNAPIA